MLSRNRRARSAPTMGMITSSSSVLVDSNMIRSNPQNMKQLLNPDPVKPHYPKMIWGPFIWYFFHSIAHKVKETEFLNVRATLLNLVYMICSNLPCPNCSQHAKTYLDQTNFQTIQTREQLRTFFWTFHNTVNQRKHIPDFPYSGLGDKYSSAILPNVINQFIAIYTKKTKNVRFLADDLQRTRITNAIKDFYTSNLNAFE